MTQFETSPLISQAEETYLDYEMDALPLELQRDSRYFYYLSVYPGLKHMHELTPDEQPQLPETVTSAYIHTPYCTGACSFCSYFLKTVDEDSAGQLDDYMKLVQQETEQQSRQTELDLSYLYFGGGTPSLIPNRTLDNFLTFMDRRGYLNDDRMGTIELHPEFFRDYARSQEFLGIMRAHNIGRVSLGFQSSDESVLEDTNRRHDTSFLMPAIEQLKDNGMKFNLDLMYGLPGLSLKDWERTLNEAMACEPDSIATYFLFVNRGTAMHAQVSRGEIALPTHRQIQTQHLMARIALDAQGFHELPNDFYAKPTGDSDPAAFSPTVLASNTASLPLGAGSYGHYDNTQFFKQFSHVDYRQQVERGESTIWRGHHFEGVTGAHRDIMFALKNDPYVDAALFRSAYNMTPRELFPAVIDQLVARQLIVVNAVTNDVRLTPKGQLCVEEIACQFEIPGLKADNTPVSATEKRKLDKHHFAPTYSLLPKSNGTQS